MSETAIMEPGDNPQESDEIKQLHEMFNQESAPEHRSTHSYVPDAPTMPRPELQPEIGDMVLESHVRRSITGQRAGAITLRRVHIRPVQPTWIN